MARSTARKSTTSKSTISKTRSSGGKDKTLSGVILAKHGDKTVGGMIVTGSDPATVHVYGTAVPIVPFRTELLIERVGSVTEVAALLGVAKSQPTRWRKGEATPSPEKARLLNDLEHVFSRAALIFEPDVIKDWMTGPNSYLQGARPIDVLRSRGVSDVLNALDAAEQIAFGG